MQRRVLVTTVRSGHPAGLFRLGLQARAASRCDAWSLSTDSGRAGPWLPWARVSRRLVPACCPCLRRSTQLGHGWTPSPKGAHCGCGRAGRPPCPSVWFSDRSIGGSREPCLLPGTALASTPIRVLAGTTSVGWQACGNWRRSPRPRRAGPPESRGAVGEASRRCWAHKEAGPKRPISRGETASPSCPDNSASVPCEEVTGAWTGRGPEGAQDRPAGSDGAGWRGGRA